MEIRKYLRISQGSAERLYLQKESQWGSLKAWEPGSYGAGSSLGLELEDQECWEQRTDVPAETVRQTEDAFSLPLHLCSVQALNGLNDVHLHWTESSELYANLLIDLIHVHIFLLSQWKHVLTKISGHISILPLAKFLSCMFNQISHFSVTFWKNEDLQRNILSYLWENRGIRLFLFAY